MYLTLVVFVVFSVVSKLVLNDSWSLIDVFCKRHITHTHLDVVGLTTCNSGVDKETTMDVISSKILK